MDADVVDAPVVHLPSASLALILAEARPIYEEMRGRLAGAGGGREGKLYVTRKSAASRRIVNEEAVMVALLGARGSVRWPWRD